MTPSNARWPQVLLAGMVVATVVAFAFAGSTSGASFSAYNRGWSGASVLEGQAKAVDSQSIIVRDTSAYGSTPPNETVAVILSPDREYDPDEAARVSRFVESGGTLVVADDFGSHANPLLATLGVTARIDGTLVRDDRYNYRSSGLPVATNVSNASRASNASLVRNVSQLVLNYGSVVRPGEARILVNTSQYAYLDRNRNGEVDADELLGRRPVATVERVGAGRVVVVSDPSVFINAMLEHPGNREFVRNVFRTGDYVLLDYSHSASLPPLAVAVLVMQNSALLQVGLGVLGLALVAGWARSRPLASVRDRLDRSPDADSMALSTDDVVTAVERRYPELDGERVRRVASRLDRVDESNDAGGSEDDVRGQSSEGDGPQ